MDNLIQISKINDFIFCPYSIYLHSIYENFSEKTYHDIPQSRGRIRHKNIDIGKYSTAAKFLQGAAIYSEEHGLIGKLDIYNKETQELIERKYRVKQIFEGYKYQLYAQKLCLEEQGLQVSRMLIHSLADNKRYEIIMSNDDITAFFNLISEMRIFSLEDFRGGVSPNKCLNCIYSTLCEHADTTGF